jgi:DNA-binding transcriptional ArsR family regulator
MQISDRTREACLEAVAADAARRNEARGRAEATRAVIVEQATADAVAQRVARSIIRILTKSEDWVTRGELNRKIGSDGRRHLDEALGRLLDAGQITAEDYEYRGQPTTRYKIAERAK